MLSFLMWIWILCGLCSFLFAQSPGLSLSLLKFEYQWAWLDVRVSMDLMLNLTLYRCDFFRHIVQEHFANTIITDPMGISRVSPFLFVRFSYYWVDLLCVAASEGYFLHSYLKYDICGNSMYGNCLLIFDYVLLLALIESIINLLLIITFRERIITHLLFQVQWWFGCNGFSIRKIDQKQTIIKLNNASQQRRPWFSTANQTTSFIVNNAIFRPMVHCTGTHILCFGQFFSRVGNPGPWCVYYFSSIDSFIYGHINQMKQCGNIPIM